jgi:hypothetical protein
MNYPTEPVLNHLSRRFQNRGLLFFCPSHKKSHSPPIQLAVNKRVTNIHFFEFRS